MAGQRASRGRWLQAATETLVSVLKRNSGPGGGRSNAAPGRRRQGGRLQHAQETRMVQGRRARDARAMHSWE